MKYKVGDILKGVSGSIGKIIKVNKRGTYVEVIKGSERHYKGEIILTSQDKIKNAGGVLVGELERALYE